MEIVNAKGNTKLGRMNGKRRINGEIGGHSNLPIKTRRFYTSICKIALSFKSKRVINRLLNKNLLDRIEFEALVP